MIWPSWIVKVPSPLSAPISAIGLRPVPCRSRSMRGAAGQCAVAGKEVGEIGAGEPDVAVEAEPVVAALEAHRAGHAAARDRAVDLFERE